MTFDISQIPFSAAGSHMAVSMNEAGFRGADNDPGLFLRTVRRSSYQPFIAQLIPLLDGSPVPFHCEADPAELSLFLAGGRISLCFADWETILIKGAGKGVGFMLDFMTKGGPYDYAYEIREGGVLFYMANCYKNNRKYLARAQKGALSLDQEWKGCAAEHSRIRAESSGGEFLLSLREIATEWDGSLKPRDYGESRAKTSAEFEAFLDAMPSAPARYQKGRRRAAYVDWSCIARKEGFLSRDAMYMSKNWMCSVWSWDHCFNAIALSYGNSRMAWDQFMLMFDYQDPFGLIPDSVNDSHVTWNYCKPPIHGWALRKIMANMTLSVDQELEAYSRLGSWTYWWLNHRDRDHDGICEYNHGNDSGWDNSTIFTALPPIESPELQAFLILQMDVLAELADGLGKGAEAAGWRDRAGVMLEKALRHCFAEGKPVAVRSGSHERIDCESLLPYLSLVLGEKLPEPLRESMLAVLKDGTFLTDYGYATESPGSPRYESDGYWRGPIWAPSTILLLDGLKRCGEIGLARSAAEKFCDMALKSGFAENYDALSGEGLRDKAYTWTASVFMILAHEFL